MKIDFALLEKSLEDSNFEVWDEAVHKIYGACAHIGANALAAVCDEGQKLLSVREIDKIPAQHQVIMMEYVRVNDALDNKRTV